MRWSYRIATLFGTEVRVHVTFVALLAWYAFVAWRVGGDAAAAWAVGFLSLVFASVLLHEFGHVLMAKRFGIRTPDILLSPIGGLARLERMPEEPRQELLVALAGPAVTLGIVALLAGARSLSADPQALWVFNPGHERLLPALLRANIVLLGFNLLPAFPMDGGRVLRAVLSSRIGLVRGTRIAARIGQTFAFGLGLFGLWASPMLVLIAGFIYLAAEAEANAVETRAAGQGMTAAAMMITNLRTLPVYATLTDAIALLLSGEQREFPIVDNDGRLEGMLTRDHLIRGLAEQGPGATVGTVMAAGVEGVSPSLSFDQAMNQLRAGGLAALPVVTPDRVVIGLITADNVTDLLLVRRHLPAAR
ncbi:MAG TPA: site-2 protease family protein [Gemmatimonadales bacterium]